jgi:hypothetical protein
VRYFPVLLGNSVAGSGRVSSMDVWWMDGTRVPRVGVPSGDVWGRAA